MTITRYVGNCQLCEGDFKLTPDKRMVHHGYKRPGYGYIVGDCPGVDEVPYETSCEKIKTVLVGWRAEVVVLRKFLSKLEADEVSEITIKRYGYRFTAPDVYNKDTDPHWRAHLNDKISDVKNELKMVDREIERLDKRIANWQKLPLRTVEEVESLKGAERKAASDARATEMQKRREEKAAKRAAIDAKAKALEEKKLAMVKATIEKLRVMGDSENARDKRWEALELMSRLEKKVGWKYYHPKEWHIDHQLLALGVAKYVGAHVQYDRL